MSLPFRGSCLETVSKEDAIASPWGSAILRRGEFTKSSISIVAESSVICVEQLSSTTRKEEKPLPEFTQSLHNKRITIALTDSGPEGTNMGCNDLTITGTTEGSCPRYDIEYISCCTSMELPSWVIVAARNQY